MSVGAIRAGKAFIEMTLDDSALWGGLRRANKRLRTFGATVGLMGASIVGGMAGVAAAFAPTIAAASDLQETMNKFDVVFGDRKAEVKAWSDNFADEVGRSKKQIADFMAGSQDLFVPLGFEAGAAEDMSKQITALSLDLASFNNMADEDTLRDLHAALTGSGEVMKKYGVIVSEAAVKQRLLDDGLDPKNATEQQKVMARLAIIMDGTTAAQGDAIRSAGGYANQMKALEGKLFDVKAAIGNALLPMVTAVVGKFNAGAKIIEAFVEDNQSMIATVAVAAATIAGIGVALMTVGTAAVALSFVVSGLGIAWGWVVGMLGAAGGAIAFLFSPMGLLTVAIGGVVYALLKWTTVGNRVANTVSGTFMWLLGQAKRVFGGIADALSAGEFELAGRIAMATLKTVLLGGMAKISTLFGGQFGDMLGTIGGQIAGGDFAGAWETAVMAMAMLWDGFTEGIVAAFTEAARAVVNTWQDTVGAITDYVLKDAASGGVFGSIALAGTGVDLQKEQGRAELLRQQEINTKRRLLASAETDARDAQLRGDNEEAQRQLNFAVDLRKQLAALNAAAPPNVLGDAQADARRQIAGVADGLRGTLDEMARDAQRQTDESAMAFKERTAGGADYANDELAKAQAELDALIAEAKAMRGAAGAAAGAGTSLLPDGAIDALFAAHDAGVAAMQQADKFTAQQGTFNSYTLGRLGSVAKKDKTEDNTERTADAMEELVEGAKRGDFQLTVTD